MNIKLSLMTPVLVAATLLVGSPVVQAAPIVYTSDFTASGLVGQQSFSDAAVRLTLTGDTAGISLTGTFGTNLGASTVSIGGLGLFSFTEALQVFVNQTFFPPAAGFAKADFSGSAVVTLNQLFATYDLGAIGPTQGNSFFRDDLTYGTTGGLLRFRTVSPSTFEAVTGTTVIPLPPSLVLAGFGLLSVASVAWRRRPGRQAA